MQFYAINTYRRRPPYFPTIEEPLLKVERERDPQRNPKPNQTLQIHKHRHQHPISLPDQHLTTPPPLQSALPFIPFLQSVFSPPGNMDIPILIHHGAHTVRIQPIARRNRQIRRVVLRRLSGRCTLRSVTQASKGGRTSHLMCIPPRQMPVEASTSRAPLTFGVSMLVFPRQYRGRWDGEKRGLHLGEPAGDGCRIHGRELR